MNIELGVTGTRGTLTHRQVMLSLDILELAYQLGARRLHHGDCVGADEYLAKTGRDIGYALICHPPSNSSLRAWVPSDEYREPKPYLTRNQEIVEEVGFLLALPKTESEEVRSGTWTTVRRAREKGIPVKVLGP